MNQQNVKWILFDVGGVLAPDTSAGVTQAVADTLGIEPARLAALVGRHRRRMTRGEMTVRQMYAEVVHELGSSAEPGALLDRHLAVYRRNTLPLDADLLALIDEWKTRIGVACLTNTEPEVAAASRALGIFDCFDPAMTSVELGMCKPDEEIYRAAARRLGEPPEAIVFVDDSPANVTGAMAAGMRGLRFERASQLRAALAGAV